MVAVGTLCVIALLHFYWTFGGRIGRNSALPDRSGGQGKALNPTAAITLVVTALLALAALLIAARAEWIRLPLPPWLVGTGARSVTVVLGLRAIGDFATSVCSSAFGTHRSRAGTRGCIRRSVRSSLSAVESSPRVESSTQSSRPFVGETDSL